MNCFFFSPSIFKNAWEIEWCYKYYKFYFKELTNFAQIGQFLNVFSFSLELLWLFIVFLTWNTLKLIVSLTEQTSIFTSFQLKIFKKTVWIFSFSLQSSCYESCLLEYVSCWFDLRYLVFRWWVGWMFVCAWIFGYCWLGF